MVALCLTGEVMLIYGIFIPDCNRFRYKKLMNNRLKAMTNKWFSRPMLQTVWATLACG